MLARACILIFVGALLGVGFNAARKDGLRIGSFETPAICDEAENAGESLEIDPGQVAALCGGGAIVADARPPASYAEGHVVDAIHLPCDASGTVATQAIAKLEGVKTVIVYGQTTEEALPVAASLRRRLPKGVRVAVLRGGFAAWNSAGLACASGSCDDCASGHHP